MILERYILRQLALGFLFAFTTFLSVCLLGVMFQVTRTFEGMGLLFILRTIPAAIGYVTSWALLVASCASATLVYGRLAADHEIDAMRVSGLHANHVVAPAAIFGVLLCIGSYFIIDHVAPAAHYARRSLIRSSVLNIFENPPRGAQRFRFGSYLLSYADARDGKIEWPFLMKFNPDGTLKEEHHAERGYALLEEGQPPRLVLTRPQSTLYDPDGSKKIAEADEDVAVPLEIGDLDHVQKRSADMTREEIGAWIPHAPQRKKAKALTAYHTRLAQPLAPLLLVLVATPIGIFVKRGSRLAGLGAALPPLLLYFLLFFLFQGLGENEKVAPAIAAWAPDVALGAVAFILLSFVYRK